MKTLPLLILALLLPGGSTYARDFEKTLPALAKSWLELETFPKLGTEIENLRDQIRTDEKFAKSLRQFLVDAEKFKRFPPLEIAAMHDLIGDFDEASSRYESLLSSRRPDQPHAALLHRTRTIRIQNPDWEKRGLMGVRAEPSIKRRFAYRIARMESLVRYLEKRHLEGETSAGNTMWLEEALAEGSYGDYNLPPIWMPDLPPQHGSRPPPEIVDLRQATFENVCRAALKFPDDAAWAFSRLAKLAETRGKLFDNPELVEWAKAAIATASSPTPFGGITQPNRYRSSSLLSPELYLAHHLWKTGSDIEIAARFGKGVRDRFALFVCDPDDFVEELKKVIGVDEDPADEAVEAIRIWALRGHDVDLTETLIAWEFLFAGGRMEFRGNPQRLWLDYLDQLARVKHPERVRDALEKLAQVYLGRPENRARELESFRDRTPPGKRMPMGRKYFELLLTMSSYPALIFPAHTTAEGLGIQDLTSASNWMDSDDFREDPKRVIEKLALSPFIEPVHGFRLIESKDTSFIRGLNASKPTVFGRIAFSISKLTPEEQKPFRDFLTAQDTFGADFLLASIAGDDGKKIEEFLFENLVGIRANPDDKLAKELAIFASVHLPRPGGDHSDAIRAALAGGLARANRERADKLVATFSNSDNVHVDSGSILPLIIRDSPELAVATLREILAARELEFVAEGRDLKSIARQNAGWLSELLRYATYDLDRHPEDQWQFFRFYLRFLADPEISPQLLVNLKWLTPLHVSPATPEERPAYFEKALSAIIESLPDSVPPDLLFFPVFLQIPKVVPREKGVEFDPKSLSASVEKLTGDRRKTVEAAIALGALQAKWHREKDAPKVDDPENAAAFAEWGKRLGNESLPRNLRLAFAPMFLSRGSPHIPSDLQIQLAALLGESWKSLGPVSEKGSESILENFLRMPTSPDWKTTAAALLAAWKGRVEAFDRAAGKPFEFQYTESPTLLIGAAAQLGDQKMLDWLLKPRWEKIYGDEPILPLSHLIRAGKFDRALVIQKKYMPKIAASYGFGGVETDGAARVTLPGQWEGRYDRKLHDNLPAFLAKIGSPEERAMTWMFMNSPAPDRFDPSLPDRTTRYTEIAKFCLEIDLVTDPSGTGPMYRQLASDPKAAAALYDDLVRAFDIDKLAENLPSETNHRWGIYGEATITALITAGRIDQAREWIRKVGEVIRPGADPGVSSKLWKDISVALYRCVNLRLGKSEDIAHYLPIARDLAPLPASLPEKKHPLWIKNYARNIAWHALADEMDTWEKWHAALPEKTRIDLDQLFRPQSQTILSIASYNTRNDDIEKRLTIAKRMLTLPEVIGTSGPLHDDLIPNLLQYRFFKEEELLEHGAALFEGIPDGGNAEKAIDAMRQ